MEKIPILGAPWCFYSDESGKRDPSERALLCFAIIAIPEKNNESLSKVDIKKIKKGNRAKKEDIEYTKSILAEHGAFVCITYIDFKDPEIHNVHLYHYNERMKKSTLCSKEIPSKSNFTWAIVYGSSIGLLAFDMLKKNKELRSIDIKYHNYVMRLREKNIIEKIIKYDFVDKIREVCNTINQRAGYTYLKGQDITIVEIKGVKDNYACIRMADQLAGFFRRQYERHNNSALNYFIDIFGEENIRIDNLNSAFKRWRVPA
jgi:hypothetical protein